MQKSKMELATAKLQQETEYQSHRVELEKMEQYITNLLSEMQKLETRNSKNKWGIFLIALMLIFGYVIFVNLGILGGFIDAPYILRP